MALPTLAQCEPCYAALMQISELAQRTGVSIHRLRRYEAAGLIAAERSGAGYRRFAERTVRQVVFISMGRELGVSLKALGESLPRYRAGTLSLDQLIELLQERIAEVDAAIATFIATLEIPAAERERLLAMTPGSYTGQAVALAQRIG